MAILNIRKAQRAGARLVIGIAGVSGSGKTFTALQLAWGLAGGDANKVGMLDTENRRGSLYADILRDRRGKVHPFLIGDLDAPFTPERFIAAILEFQAAGVKVLVIDTASHEWAGLGGCLDIANSHAKSVHGWKDAKPRHKKFMNTMLQSDMHIIVCIRATQKVDWSDAKNPKSLGFVPLQQEEFMFEMTASMMMWNGGQQRQILKCPAELEPIFGKNGSMVDGYLTAKQGLALQKWVDGGAPVDAQAEHARNTLRSVAEQGVQALHAAWGNLPAESREALGGAVPQEIVEAAQAFDDQRKASAAGGSELADLNSEVLGGDDAQDAA